MAMQAQARANGDGRQTVATGGRNEFVLDNGNKFYIRRYDAFLSLRILGEVQKRFLSPLAAMMEVRDEKGDEARMEAMFDALERLSKGLDGEQLVSLARLILNPDFVSVSIDGEPPQQVNEGTLNLAISDVADVVALVIEVMKVNYTELFTRGRTLIGQAQSVTANP